MKFGVMKYLLVIILVFTTGCANIITRYSVITVIGVDKSGSFIGKGDEGKKQLVSRVTYEIIKSKSDFQEKDKRFWRIRKWLMNVKSDNFERVIIAPISFRGAGGISQFLLFNDDPLSIFKSPNFESPEKLKEMIFPKNEGPMRCTDFLQFFKEINSVIKPLSEGLENVRVHYIMITDGLPDPKGDEMRASATITSEELINIYGKEYAEGLNNILFENVKISFIGVDTNILEFWNYIGGNIGENKKVKILHITTDVQQVSEDKIKELSNPFRW